MFMTVLFIIAKTWKQPRYPSLSKEINCPGNGILLSTERNELSSYEKMWRHLKYMLLSETSQSEKLYTGLFQLYILYDRKRQNYGGSRKTYSCQGLGQGGDEQAEHGGYLGQ